MSVPPPLRLLQSCPTGSARGWDRHAGLVSQRWSDSAGLGAGLMLVLGLVWGAGLRYWSVGLVRALVSLFENCACCVGDERALL